MKLISMVDFILKHLDTGYSLENALKNNILILKYAKFLKQPLQLGFFVPCDEKGNVLQEPMFDPSNEQYWAAEHFQYQIAKERVLFEGWIYTGDKCVKHGMLQYNLDRNNYTDIESLLTFTQALKYLELTESAIKQIGL